MLSLSPLVKKSESRIKIVVGSVVTTNLYGLSRGVVYQIHGEQMPDTVRQLGGGVVATGGHAEFDIVHECGKFSKRLPECILRGVQWGIYDEIEDAETIRELCERAEEKQAEQQRKEEREKALFDAEVERLKTAPEYAHLEQGECGSGKLAAKNIRKELKQFKGVKFSVRNSYHGFVSVSWTDGPTKEKVKGIINKYKAGHFNSMQDIYEYSDDPFNVVFGSVEYPDAQRSYSDVMAEKAIGKIIKNFGLEFETLPTGEDYRKGKLWSVKLDVFHHGLQSQINSVLADME